MAGEVTLQQLLQTPVITRVVSQIKTPSSLMQSFYGMTSGGAATETVQGRYFGYDIFNVTRTIAGGRAPGSGPSRIKHKPIGQVTGQVFRVHEAIHLDHEKIFRTRPLGAGYGTVDLTGQNYIMKQVAYGTQRVRNVREFMVSRMFRGGFGVAVSGDDWTLTELNDASAVFNVNMQLPSANTGKLDLGTGSDIVTTSWIDPGADIVGQMYAMNNAFERLHGYPLRHAWINASNVPYLLNNAGLHAIGGSSMTVFDSLSRRQLNSAEGIPDSGYEIVFRALPQFTFHAYSQGLSADGTDSTALSSFSPFIPTTHAIFTPEPSPNWCGSLEGSEFVREHLADGGSVKTGFATWNTNTIDPAGVDVKFLDNFVTALYVPSAVAYGNVFF